MKVYAIVNVGRQVQGEAVAVKIEKGYLNKDTAWAEASQLASQQTEIINNVQFLCERGVYEIDILDYKGEN
jgi:hypothetical protein